MKNKLNILVVFILIVGLSVGCSTVQEVENIPPEPTPAPTVEATQPPVVVQELGYGAVGSFDNTEASLEQMLIYAIEDERLARSEYEYIINELEAGSPFTNIIKAEETHIALLIPLFEAYGYTLPEDTSKEHLIPAESITAALETGVQAEIDNIAMYELFLELDLPDDVRDVFIELRDGSINHLAAFQRKLSR